MLRLFVGLELPPNLQKELFSIKPIAKKEISSIRWVPVENMHITLKFLGSCADDAPDKIIPALSGVISNFKSFHFKLGELGGFPSLKRARIFWMGVTEGGDKMIDLASLVEKALVSLGFEKEDRKFHPHITLARLKKPQDLQEIAANQDLKKIEESLIKVDCVTLFKSTLTPHGAIYETLDKVPLVPLQL